MTDKAQFSTRESILALLLKKGECSAINLSSAIGISVQAMRRHLRNLEFDGFLTSKLSSVGPGRPSNVWQLTPLGYRYFNSSDGSEKFAIDLLSSIESTLSKEQISELLAEQALKKAIAYRHRLGKGNISQRLQKLVELQNEEGYLSECQPSSDDSQTWYLNAFHCSIRNIAEHYPVICDQELDLIRKLFPDCSVTRVQWRLENGLSCAFQIKPN